MLGIFDADKKLHGHQAGRFAGDDFFTDADPDNVLFRRDAGRGGEGAESVGPRRPQQAGGPFAFGAAKIGELGGEYGDLGGACGRGFGLHVTRVFGKRTVRGTRRGRGNRRTGRSRGGGGSAVGRPGGVDRGGDWFLGFMRRAVSPEGGCGSDRSLGGGCDPGDSARERERVGWWGPSTRTRSGERQCEDACAEFQLGASAVGFGSRMPLKGNRPTEVTRRIFAIVQADEATDP